MAARDPVKLDYGTPDPDPLQVAIKNAAKDFTEPDNIADLKNLAMVGTVVLILSYVTVFAACWLIF